MNESPETWAARKARKDAEGINLHLPLTIAARMWPMARSEDSECAGNHPGAVDSLTGATKLWQTPHGMANTDKTGKKGGAGGGEFALQANNWGTPRVTTNSGIPCPEHTGKGSRLEDQAALMAWPTPMQQDSESAGSVAKGEFLTQASMTFPSSPPAPPTEPPGQESSQGGQDSRPLWPSPCAYEDSKAHGMRPSRIATGRKTEYLHRVVQDEKRRLNPAFVDWLMGYPIGHSDCDSTVTPCSLSRWRRLSSLCLRHWLAKVTE